MDIFWSANHTGIIVEQCLSAFYIKIELLKSSIEMRIRVDLFNDDNEARKAKRDILTQP
jgi:hypothetical protein